MLLKEKVRVRRFEIKDLEEVKELIARTIEVCYGDYYLKEVIDFFGMFHWDGNILKTALDGYIAVAEVNGRITATGSLMDDFILRVFVDPKHQKKGLGRMIMVGLERQASARGVKVLRLRSLASSRKFYESLGYKTVERGFEEVDNRKFFEYYRMVKEIGTERDISAGGICKKSEMKHLAKTA
jgi:GNAT superfamily N-acetyltransferase